MRIFKYIAFLISIIVIYSCDTEKKTLKVGTNVWPGYEAIYVAREKGYLPDNIKLIEFGSASQIIRAYRRKLIQGAGLTVDEVIFLKAIGFSPKIILVADVSNGADVLIAKPYIKTLKDLKDKKIGVENTALGAFFLARILEIAGLTEKDIKVIPLEVNEHFEAFVSNKVDAVITFEPVKTQLLKQGGVVLLDSSKIPNEIVDVFIVESDFIDKHPNLVKEFVITYFKGLKELKSSFQYIADREKVSIEELKNSYKGLKLPDEKENLYIMTNTLRTTIIKIKSIMESKNLIPKTNFKPEELIYVKFIQEIAND